MFQRLDSARQVRDLVAQLGKFGPQWVANVALGARRRFVENAFQMVARPPQTPGEVFQGVPVPSTRPVVLLKLANCGFAYSRPRNKFSLSDSQLRDAVSDGFGHSIPVVTHEASTVAFTSAYGTAL